MADQKSVLKRPPGYKDPNAPSMPATPNVVPPPPQRQQQQQQQQQQPPSIRKSQIPPMYRPKPKRKRSCCRCCCCFFCTLLFLIILFLLIAGTLFYLMFEPELPNFHLESLKFSTFKVSVTPDGTFLDAQTDVRFEVSNPNTKIGIMYDKTEVKLLIGDSFVDAGSASIPAFNQGKRNITMLKFGSGVKHKLIEDEAGTKMKKQIQTKQMLVTMAARTNVGLSLEGGWKIGKMPVRVLCRNMNLNKLDGGQNPKCAINIFTWITI